MGRQSEMGNLRRLLAALALIVSLGLATAQVAAQDGSTAGGYVSVGCSVDAASGTTWCTFSTAAGESITVPAEVFCAQIGDLGNGSWADGGVVAAGSSLTVGFAGQVSVAGSATYLVSVGGVQHAVAGDGLVCGGGAPPAPPAEETISGAELPVPAEEVVTEQIVDGTQDGESAPPLDSEATGTVVSASEEIPVTSEVIDVTVTVMAYDCDVDPAGADPSTLSDCAPAANVSLLPSADGTALAPVSTDTNGSATVSAPDGSALVIVEDQSSITAGYVPYGNGIANLVASDGAVVVFIHLLEPQVGRLQIVNGSCPTSGESRTEFRVIEPRSIQAASEPACTATGGTTFLIEGGASGTLTVVTESDGTWRGFLPAGTYTIVDDSGAAASVRVLVDEISIVVVIDYVSNPLGVLHLSRIVCTDAAESTVTLTGSFDAPVLGDDCERVDGDMTVEPVAEVAGAAIDTITLGPDGAEEIEVVPGDYRVTDVTSGESGVFTVARSSRLYVVAQEFIEAAGGSGDGGGNSGGGDNTGGGAGTGGTDNGGPGGGNGGGPVGGGDGDGTGGDDTTGEPIGGDGTDGGTDGENGGGYAGPVDDEVLRVTALPETGAGAGHRDAATMLVLASAVAAGGAVALRRKPAA